METNLKLQMLIKKEKLEILLIHFTTSTLQQEAARKLNFKARKTMMLAQQLYEGIDLKRQGTVGLITYMRTDSTRISQTAKDEAKQYIEDKYGKDYLSNRTARVNRVTKMPTKQFDQQVLYVHLMK